jgi:threonine dehydratase
MVTTMLPSLAEIESAARVVYGVMPPTPQYCWPLLCERLGAEVWVKHENHTPLGAFKIRGGLTYFESLARDKNIKGVITATRGNHGQSVGFAARLHGLPATIVVPFGNSVEKNAAMRAQGVQLIEHGAEFQVAREYAEQLAQELSLHMVPSFHFKLMTGVATYSLEFLRAVPDLDVVYMPIGMGSGICGMVAAREALGRKVEIVGVVSAAARAYAESFTRHRPLEAPVTTKLADGMACRTPDSEALEIMWRHVARMVEVTDAEVAQAMAMVFECTHNVAEGAGAASLAAAWQERERLAGRKVGVVVSGGNVDRDVFGAVLSQSLA